MQLTSRGKKNASCSPERVPEATGGGRELEILLATDLWKVLNYHTNKSQE